MEAITKFIKKDKEVFTSYIEDKRKYFDNLLKISAYQEIEIWAEGWLRWFKLSELDVEKYVIKRFDIHRSILRNEWVFDIDGEDWSYVKELALALIKALDYLKIDYNIWTSGNWLHIHVFIDDSVEAKANKYFVDVALDYFKNVKKVKEFSIEDVLDLKFKIFREIALSIVDSLPQSEKANIDIKKLLPTRSLIRMEGSKNEKTGFFKSYLEEIPEEKPQINCSWKVEFPDKIKVWKPEMKDLESLFFYSYEQIRERESFKEIPSSPKTKSKKYEWIENLLKIPLSDGRHRVVNLIFAPYFNVIKENPEVALAKILKWIEECNKLKPTKVNRSYVSYQLKYSLRRNLFPISLEKAKKLLSDVPEFIDFLERKGGEFV